MSDIEYLLRTCRKAIHIAAQRRMRGDLVGARKSLDIAKRAHEAAQREVRANVSR